MQTSLLAVSAGPEREPVLDSRLAFGCCRYSNDTTFSGVMDFLDNKVIKRRLLKTVIWLSQKGL